MKGCLVVFKMNCSLMALLVIFCALNLALSISFIAKISPFFLCLTRTTLPKAPSPMAFSSQKSSMLGWGSSPLHVSCLLSSSSAMEPRNAWLKAPRPALNIKDEIPQLLILTFKFWFMDLLLDVLSASRKNLRSSDGFSGTRGTECCVGYSWWRKPSGPNTSPRQVLGVVGVKGARTLAPLRDGLSMLELLRLNVVMSVSSKAWCISVDADGKLACIIALRNSPAFAKRNNSAMTLSRLFLSKPNFSDGPHSAGVRPALFFILKFALGSMSSSFNALTFCRFAATWTAESPSALMAFRRSKFCNRRHVCTKKRMASGLALIAARCSAVLRIWFPVRAEMFARSSTNSRMQSTCPRTAAKCNGVRPSGPYRLMSRTRSELRSNSSKHS
mmetsp:Transcript_41490/g.119678  ORF Transcript_41490/g.119678 Transcript_41490/m.119678 type:complete len:387 (+) Transcript_41490:939-2099(+)